MYSTERAQTIADRVERFVRETVIPYEKDPRCSFHGPSDDLVMEMRALARDAGTLTPHILPDGTHLTQRETATVLIRSGLSPLGPLACTGGWGMRFQCELLAATSLQTLRLTPAQPAMAAAPLKDRNWRRVVVGASAM